MNKNVEKLKQKRIVAEVPEVLHQEIKVQASYLNITMRNYIVRALLERIRKDKVFQEH